jgi:hypothetical protein
VQSRRFKNDPKGKARYGKVRNTAPFPNATNHSLPWYERELGEGGAAILQDMHTAAIAAANRTHHKEWPWIACYEGAQAALSHYLIGDLPSSLNKRLDERAGEWTESGGDRRQRISVFKHVASKLMPTFTRLEIDSGARPFADLNPERDSQGRFLSYEERLERLGARGLWVPGEGPGRWQRGRRVIPSPKIEQRILREELGEMRRVDKRTAAVLEAFLRGGAKLGDDQEMTLERGAAEMFGGDVEQNSAEYQQYRRAFRREGEKLRRRVTITIETLADGTP